MNLVANDVSDLSRLSGLTSLTSLSLSINNITDISPVAGLTSLTYLDIGANNITDISALAGLTSLIRLSIVDNNIADISALAGLAAIKHLFMEGNHISDLSPLAGLTSIEAVRFVQNNVYDISALVANDSIGSDTFVEMWTNPFGCAALSDAATLRARGAMVSLEDYSEVPPPAPTDLALAVAGDTATLTWGGSTDYREQAHVFEVRHGSPAELGDWTMVPGPGCRVQCAPAREVTVPVPGLGDDEYVFEVRGVNAAGCGAIASTSTGAPSGGGDWLPDDALRRCIGKALGKPPGAQISREEMATLRRLVCRNAGIADLAGLETATALAHLDLFGNVVADIAPLRELAQLAELALHGNRISNLAPLAETTALTKLWLNDNAVADIAPLGDNLSLGTGVICPDGSSDYVDLRGNALNAMALDTHVPALRERGAAVLIDGTHLVPVFLSGGSAFGESFARVINRSAQAGEVSIEAIDASGQRYGPVALTIGTRHAAHFTATDLELGNAAKGLATGLGYGAGEWRLELRSALDLDVSAYLRARTSTGAETISSMSATAPEAYAQHQVFTFNPGDADLTSKLRLINPRDKMARAFIEGTDDSGATAILAVTVPAGGLRDFTAATLEAGDSAGVVDGLGNGAGRWRLTATSYDGVQMLSLFESPTQMTNLSSAAPAGSPQHLPLFPAASPAREGFIRIVNLSGTAGSVELRAFDQNGLAAAPVPLALGTGGTEVSWRNLASGSSALGLPNGIGDGNWRLELHTALDIRAMSYLRTGEALYALHPVAPRTDDGTSHVAMLNPASNQDIAGVLRLVNVGDAAAQVQITGIDDRGDSPGGVVRTTVPAGATREFTATELESGNADALAGALGGGHGRWRLQVATDGDLRVLSLMASAGGLLTNVSQ